jgi:hypothetical protein
LKKSKNINMVGIEMDRTISVSDAMATIINVLSVHKYFVGDWEQTGRGEGDLILFCYNKEKIIKTFEIHVTPTSKIHVGNITIETSTCESNLPINNTAVLADYLDAYIS